MYDLPELRSATDALWAAVRDRLRAGGLAAPHELDRDADYHGPWTAPDLVLSETCGWPLVTWLDGRVDVVGTFRYDTATADGATYRSRLVTRIALADRPLTELVRRRAAVNHTDSLSGWVSLLRGFGVDGGSWPGSAAVVTGGHAASLAALQRGELDVAAVDSVTWDLLGDVRPEATAGLATVGFGPRIPCLPLITRPGGPVDALRAALTGAVVDPALQPALRPLRIVGFEPSGGEFYDPVRMLGPA
jgi:ABC-type phosphate/phosphonate transport system substrate-binding protein